MPWRWRVVWGHWKVLNVGLDNLLATLIFWDPKRNHFQINKWPTAKGSFVAILEGIWPQKHREPRHQKATSDVHCRDRHRSLTSVLGVRKFTGPHPSMTIWALIFIFQGKELWWQVHMKVTPWHFGRFRTLAFRLGSTKIHHCFHYRRLEMEPEKQFKLPPIRNKAFLAREYFCPATTGFSLKNCRLSRLRVYDRSIKLRKPYRNVYPPNASEMNRQFHPPSQTDQACARPCATTPPPVPINIRPETQVKHPGVSPGFAGWRNPITLYRHCFRILRIGKNVSLLGFSVKNVCVYVIYIYIYINIQIWP